MAANRIAAEATKFGKRALRKLGRIGSRVRPSPQPADQPAEPTPELPRVSVVIPAYNVEAYFERSLHSVIGQNYDNLEILVVDDGSTDNTRAIAHRLARADARITVLELDHCGNGAARNRAIEQATGKYLAFADADDEVAPDAYQTMVNKLENTGSDFVVGNFHHENDGKWWKPKRVTSSHAEPCDRATVTGRPDILHNVFLWDKLFDKSFWDRSVAPIPEGTLYEDQESIARAYLAASAFDIIQEPVYVWHSRPDWTSIIRRKGDLQDVTDRMRMVGTVTSLIQRHDPGGISAVTRTWVHKLVTSDFHLYYYETPKQDEEYWSVFRDGIAAIFPTLEAAFQDVLSLHDRILIYLIANDHRDAVEANVISRAEVDTSYRIVQQEGTLVGLPGYLGDLGGAAPDELFTIRDQDLTLETQLTRLRWADSDHLEIRGHAFIRNFDTVEHTQELQLDLVNQVTAEKTNLAVERVDDPDIDLVAGDAWNRYRNGGFRAVVDVEPLRESAKHSSAKPWWRLEARVRVCDRELTGPFTSRNPDSAGGRMDLAGNIGRRRIISQFNSSDGLFFEPVQYEYEATDCEIADAVATLTLHHRSGGAPSAAEVMIDSETRLAYTLIPIDDSRTQVRVELPSESTLDADRVRVSIKVRSPSGVLVPVGWSRSTADTVTWWEETGNWHVAPSGYGYLELARSRHRCIARSVEHGTDAVTVSGECSADLAEADGAFILANSRAEIIASGTSIDPDRRRFSAHFELRHNPWNLGRVIIDSGAYTLYFADDAKNRTPVATARDLQPQLPCSELTESHRLTVTANKAERDLVIKVGAPLTVYERSAYGRRQLRERFFSDDPQPIRENVIFFESYGGKFVTDSCRAIFDELVRRNDSRELIWSVKDYSVHIPENCTPVVVGSDRYYTALNTSKTLINNNTFPWYFRKRQGQYYLQTWHGTPIKKIGFDTPLHYLSASYINILKRERKYWNLLLAETSEVGALLASAFYYDGEIYDAGYPRNAKIASRTCYASLRSRAKRSLGISNDEIVVLYAPTWREAKNDSYGVAQRVEEIRYDLLYRLGPRQVKFLYRGHHTTVLAERDRNYVGVVDVTTYPDIDDLYAVADVLISDFSSAIYDFAITEKPIIRLISQNGRKWARSRGCYKNMDRAAPGTVVRREANLPRVLENAAAGENEFYCSDTVAGDYASVACLHIVDSIL